MFILMTLYYHNFFCSVIIIIYINIIFFLNMFIGVKCVCVWGSVTYQLLALFLNQLSVSN